MKTNLVGGMERVDFWLKQFLRLRENPRDTPYLAVLPLRLFLGITFIYAGLNKFSDPQFFSPTAPGFIGRQMSGYVHIGSPLSPLLTHLAIPHPAFFGALIALGEIWIGISTLAGLLTCLGALGGLLTNLVFFLTASWTVHPYFLGADLPFAAGWLTLLLAGPGHLSLDEFFFGRPLRSQLAPVEPFARSGRRGREPAIPQVTGQQRMTRAVLARGLATAAFLAVIGAISGGITKLHTPNKVYAQAAIPMAPPTPPAEPKHAPAVDSSPSPAATPAPTGSPAKSGYSALGPTPPANENHAPKVAPTETKPVPTKASTPLTVPHGATLLGNVKEIPLNRAGGYTDPKSGHPALFIHLPSGQFVAYDAVCTHAGCTVEYSPTQHLLVCPCHGSIFDPAHGARVLAGPAPAPLTKLTVEITANGDVYTTD